MQLLCLSIIGTYLAHMYEEIKCRPPFVVESILNRPQDAELPQEVPSQQRPARPAAPRA